MSVDERQNSQGVSQLQKVPWEVTIVRHPVLQQEMKPLSCTSAKPQPVQLICLDWGQPPQPWQHLRSRPGPPWVQSKLSLVEVGTISTLTLEKERLGLVLPLLLPHLSSRQGQA